MSLPRACTHASELTDEQRGALSALLKLARSPSDLGRADLCVELERQAVELAGIRLGAVDSKTFISLVTVEYERMAPEQWSVRVEAPDDKASVFYYEAPTRVEGLSMGLLLLARAVLDRVAIDGEKREGPRAAAERVRWLEERLATVMEEYDEQVEDSLNPRPEGNPSSELEQ